MIVVPDEIPVTTPVKESILAMPDEPVMFHTPPGDTSESVVVKPAQTLVIPFTVAGSGLTVTHMLAIQPVVSV